MKIRVSYAELKSDSGFNNQRAEAEIEVTVDGGPEVVDAMFTKAWERVKREVNKQLYPVTDNNIPDDMPF